MTDQVSSAFTLATTDDGSLSLRDRELDELHHNSAGAFTEAQCNYVEPTMAYLRYLTNCTAIRRDKPVERLRLLDSCFGLGYNSFALADRFARAAHFDIAGIDITAVEIDRDVLALNDLVLAQDCFAVLRQSAAGSNLFNIDVKVSCLRRFCLDHANRRFDAIYHDPFSPKKMPQLWTVDLFRIYYEMLEQNGFFLTYSCAPAVRGALTDAGFSIYATTSLGGKAGGTLAVKASEVNVAALVDNQSIKVIAGDQLHRLSTSSAVPYRDNESLTDDAATILKRRDREQKKFRIDLLHAQACE